MKKETSNKTFKIKFSVAIVILCVAIYLLCVAGIAVSVWQIARFGIPEFLDALKYPFLILVSLFAIVLVTCILIRSQYVVEGKTLISQFGFIKNKISVQEHTSVELDTAAQKLTLYSGENFSVVSINKEWNDAFIKALLKANPNIEYTFTLTDNVPPTEEP